MMPMLRLSRIVSLSSSPRLLGVTWMSLRAPWDKNVIRNSKQSWAASPEHVEIQLSQTPLLFEIRLGDLSTQVNTGQFSSLELLLMSSRRNMTGWFLTLRRRSLCSVSIAKNSAWNSLKVSRWTDNEKLIMNFSWLKNDWEFLNLLARPWRRRRMKSLIDSIQGLRNWRRSIRLLWPEKRLVRRDFWSSRTKRLRKKLNEVRNMKRESDEQNRSR